MWKIWLVSNRKERKKDDFLFQFDFIYVDWLIGNNNARSNLMAEMDLKDDY